MDSKPGKSSTKRFGSRIDPPNRFETVQREPDLEHLEWDDEYRPDRGKVLDADALEKLETFYRYLDVDGDGIPYRTIPGESPKGAYFTRGSGHTKYGKYTEDSDDFVEGIDRIAVKIDNSAKDVPGPVIRSTPDARYSLVTVGGCDGAVREAIDALEADGHRFDYMRIRGFPFSEEGTAFLEGHDLNLIVELNRDAQLMSLLTLETPTGVLNTVGHRQHRVTVMAELRKDFSNMGSLET